MVRVTFLVAGIILLFDQITKFLARNYLGFTTNTGAAFGILQGWNTILIVIALIVASVIVYYSKTYDSVPLGLLLGGTLGNVIDRIIFGHVIDFIDVGWWPSFNVADSANVIGVILLLWMYRKS